jgi:uncharacterized protein (DUF305 family)
MRALPSIPRWHPAWHPAPAPVLARVLAGVLAGTLGAVPGVQAQERPPAPPYAVVQPGAPGEASQRLSAGDLQAPERPRYTEGDVHFMQNMIHHHEQALLMSRMAPERTSRADLLLLADRIERAQADEILLMARWLELRGETVPALTVDLGERGRRAGLEAHGHHDGHDHGHHHDRPVDHHHGHDPANAPGHGHADGHGAIPMAGMLTEAQLAELAAAREEEFDALFLEFMIHHHEGALLMVDELFRSPGSARGSDIFHFASDVANDQQGEIARMRGMRR